MSQTTQLSELARALSRNRGTGMGIDPMLPAWKASVLRLSHGAPVDYYITLTPEPVGAG